ncbi:hypothetical protein ACFZBU_38805 [Embleya sp. NPDC008237]|uniref:hypothetical protein n=1 Tax=Embleya sp. NPDC008237 TaxID=3363978 RepID=UPI0036E9B5DF
MQRREYLGQFPMRVAVLPSRVVYLIEEGGSAGFRRAVREASSRWGGVTEPIVEVPADGQVTEAFREIVAAADVQVAVSVDLDEVRAQQAADQLGLRVEPLADIDRVGSLSGCTCPPFAVSPSGRTGGSLVMAQGDAPLWQVAAAGELDAVHLADAGPWLSVYRPMTDAEIGSAQIHGTTLLDRTAAQFHEHASTGVGGVVGGPVTIVVTDPDDVGSCVWFWNLRALRARTINPTHVMLVPRGGVEPWIHFPEQLRELVLTGHDRSPDVALVSLTAPEEELHRLGSHLEMTHTPGADITAVPGAPRSPGFSYIVNQEPRTWLVFDRSWGATTHVDLHLYAGENRVEFASPVSFDRPGRALVRLTSVAFDGLPRRPAVAGMVTASATWHRDSLQLQTSADRRHRMNLTIPDASSVTERLLEEATDRWEVSDKGRIAQGVLAQHAPGALLQPGMYETIIALFTKRSKELAKQLKLAYRDGDAEEASRLELARAWGGRARRTYRSVQQLSEDSGLTKLRSTIPDVLEAMCGAGWAERGLESACDHCGQEMFVPLVETTGPAPCPGCGTPARYRVDATGPTVVYRLNTFIDLAADQGVLPHLLTVAALADERPGSHLIPGANVHFPAMKREVDIYGLWGVELLAGEIKTDPEQFNAEQLQHDIDVSVRLGVDVHVMASVGVISPQLRAEAQSLCGQAKVRLHVLDKSQLRPSADSTND